MAKQKLIPLVRSVIRRKQFSLATEKSYVQWVLRYIRFHGLRHPRELREEEITQFLTYLAQTRKVSASTQNQALNALVFLYREVLGLELGDLSKFQSSR